MPTLNISARPAHEADADALVVFVRPADKSSGSSEKSAQRPRPPVLCTADDLPAPVRDHLLTSLAAIRAKGSADEVTLLTAVPGVRAGLVAVTGLGHDDPVRSLSAESVRRAAGAAARALAGRQRVSVLVPVAEAATVAAVAEGIAFGAYAFHRHRGVKATDLTGPVAQVAIHVPAAKGRRGNDGATAAAQAVSRAEVISRHQAWARDLTNTAPNELSPPAFADQVTERAGKTVSISVLDEKGLEEAGCGGILGVGLGSSRPPRIVTMTYRPRGARAHLAFVGKGITFDSGGLCLKPPTSMVTMKCDMAGAAAVAAAVLAIAELRLPVQITGILCLAENLPSSTAQRPGDVVSMRDGQTVEVINTDAEGRMVLADGLCLASESKPDAIVDVATLTGAAMTALGRRTAALLGNDDAFQAEVAQAATQAGESVWPMPIAEEIVADLASTVADWKHTGDTVGGAMVAAAFLREFIGSGAEDHPLPWAHLDVAGSAFNESKPYGYTPKGGTGFGVRTLVTLAEQRSGEVD